MRNFSMKKFGTPIGAGPGVASEKLGFDGVGTPFGWKVGAGVSSPSGPSACFGSSVSSTATQSPVEVEAEALTTEPTSLPSVGQSPAEPWARFGLAFLARGAALSTLRPGVAALSGVPAGVAVSVGACVGASVGAVGRRGGRVGGLRRLGRGLDHRLHGGGERRRRGGARLDGRLRGRGLGRGRGDGRARFVLGDRACAEGSGVEAGADQADGDDAGRERGHVEAGGGPPGGRARSAHPGFRHPQEPT